VRIPGQYRLGVYLAGQVMAAENTVEILSLKPSRAADGDLTNPCAPKSPVASESLCKVSEVVRGVPFFSSPGVRREAFLVVV
jgi:hypothetical protein